MNLIGVLAIEERHRRASLWVQQPEPSVSETDAAKTLAAPSPITSPIAMNTMPVTNPSTITTTTIVTDQDPPHIMMNPLPITRDPSPSVLSQYPATTVNPSTIATTIVTDQDPPHIMMNPLPIARDPSPSVLSQYPATTVNPSTIATTIVTDQDPPHIMMNTLPIATNTSESPLFIDSQCPETTVNPAGLTAVASQLQTVTNPSSMTNPSPIATDPNPSHVMMNPSPIAANPSPIVTQFACPQPRSVSPMTQFMNNHVTSPNDLYTWGVDNSIPTSSNSFDFSGTDQPSFDCDLGSFFGMDQYWNLNTSGTSAPVLSTMASISMPNAVDTFPTSAPQNNPISTSTDGFILPNSAYSTLSAATNTMQSGEIGETGGGDQGDKLKKRKTYEEQNAHCILPEGSRRARKLRRTEGEDENTAGAKKRNTNKKGKGSKKK
jgi:hypothetical protein